MQASLETEPVTRPRSRAVAVLRRIFPWVSLAVGIAGALFMDRGPDKALVVAIAAVVCWVLVVAVLTLRRIADRHRESIAAQRQWLVASAHFSTLAVTQSAIHLLLYFALPFYWKAWSGEVGQLVFLAALTLAALASLWDPLTERMIHRPGLAPALPAFASFGALNAVLPGLGLSNTESIWTAAAATAAALPVGLLAADLEGAARRRLVVGTIAAAASLPGAVLLGGARLIPPAPLALVSAEIGTRQEGRGVASVVHDLPRRPGLLICATAIYAPLGVRERLFHVWRQDGTTRDRIELEVRGGREEGFRTFSRKRNFGEDPRGRWTCDVETEMGQSLGGTSVVIDSPH